MSLQPYARPYCQIFYTGTVSAPGDPAPLVPPELRGPGITQVQVTARSSPLIFEGSDFKVQEY